MSESHFFSTPLVYSEACLVQVQQRGESDRPQEAAEHHRPLQEQRPSAAGGGNGQQGWWRPRGGSFWGGANYNLQDQKQHLLVQINKKKAEKAAIENELMMLEMSQMEQQLAMRRQMMYRG